MKKSVLGLLVSVGMAGLFSFASPSPTATSYRQRTADYKFLKRAHGDFQSARKAQGKLHNMLSNPPQTAIGFMSANQIALPAPPYSTWPSVSGDFNGDGKKDVATMIDTGSGAPSYQIAVSLGNGDGTFATSLTQTTATEYDQIIVGDLNGDQKDDLVMIHANGTIESWLSNGDGTFKVAGPPMAITSNVPAGAVLTHIGSDKNLDLILVDAANPGNVWTVLGNGDGTFTPAVPPSSPLIYQLSVGSITFGDFNADGTIDFAGSNAGSTNNGQVIAFVSGASGYTAVPLATSDNVYDACFNTSGNLSGHASALDITSANCLDGTVTIFINNGSGTFSTGTYYLAGSSPVAIAMADANGDGLNDLVVTDKQAGGVEVLLGDGTGNIQGGTTERPAVNYAVGGWPQTPPVVADFNGDGHLDIVVPDYRNGLVYLQGFGDASFRAAVNYYSTDLSSPPCCYLNSIEIASGDFNGDGHTDFVVGNSNSAGQASGITVFLSNGNGTLQPGVPYLGSVAGAQLGYVAVADFDGDGILDIAATDMVNGGVQIFKGAGDGTFTASATYATDTVTAATWGIVAVDLNGDGHQDLATVNVTNSGANADVGILLNNGDGTFTLKGNSTLSNVAQEITTADLNKDGKMDLVVPLFGTKSSPGSAVALLYGNGDGTFGSESDVALINNGSTFYSPVAATVADVNGDGIPDLLVTTDDQVLGSFNQGVAVALGIAGGGFGTPTLFPTSARTGADPMGIKTYDIDGDGHPDIIIANYKNGTVALLYGKGDGTFYDPLEFASARESLGIALADLNGDGAMDVVTSGDALAFSGVTALLNTSVPASIAITSSANPANHHAPVVFTATVGASSVPGAPVPTGSVTFYDGATALAGPIALSGGVASTAAINNLSLGSHSITARYNGSANYIAKSSSAIVQQILPVFDYTLSANPNSQTVNPGSSAQYTLTISPIDSYSGTVTLDPSSCQGLPDKTTCSLSSTTISAGSPSTTLTLKTTAPTTAMLVMPNANPRTSESNLWASLSGIGVFGMIVAGDWKKRNRKRLAIVLTILALTMILALVGCGSGSSANNGGGNGGGTTTPGTPAGTYHVTLTGVGNGGNTTPHTITVTLIVN